jgi:hypothetical protein
VEILNCLLKESIARTLQLQRSFRRVHDAWVAKVVLVGGLDPLICKKNGEEVALVGGLTSLPKTLKLSTADESDKAWKMGV